MEPREGRPRSRHPTGYQAQRIRRMHRQNLRKIEHIQQENAQVIEKNTSKIENYATTLRTTIPPPSATTSTYKRQPGIDFEYRHIRRQFPQ